ncbi:hypothetical protein BH09ACT8_BH09ACT8_28880 [soil metagenome]
MPFLVAVVLFLVAAVCIYLALQPKLAFQLDQSRKFKNKTEPSRTYEGFSTLQLHRPCAAIPTESVLTIKTF